MSINQQLIYTVFLSIMLQDCYAKVGKASNHVTPIYINTADSSIKASITDLPEKKPTIGRTYYWYSANKVCFTNGAYSGKLLHGQYSSYYSNHFLLAQGQFVRGLKDGRWMRWLPNGVLHEVVHYKNGLLHGYYEIYSPNGHIQQRIYYRNGARTGKTKIFSQDGKDSVITREKTGEPRKENGKRREKNSEQKEKSTEKAGDKAKQRSKEDSVTQTKSRQEKEPNKRQRQVTDSGTPKISVSDSAAGKTNRGKLLKSGRSETDSVSKKIKFLPLIKKGKDTTQLRKTNSGKSNSSSLHSPFPDQT